MSACGRRSRPEPSDATCRSNDEIVSRLDASFYFEKRVAELKDEIATWQKRVAEHQALTEEVKKLGRSFADLREIIGSEDK